MAGRRFDDAELVGEEGDDAGQAQAKRHVVVNAEHIGAQALVDRNGGPGDASAGAGVGVAVIVGHQKTSQSRGGGAALPANMIGAVRPRKGRRGKLSAL